VAPHREGDDAGGQPLLRAFFALELDPLARSAAAALARQLRQRPGGERVRWVRAESLHVTLRFLGSIAASQVTPLVRSVATQIAALAPLRLRLGAARLFPSPRRPRVVALALEPEAPLVELAAAVERGVTAAGLAPEARRFRPHLTLGRIPARTGFAGVTASDTPEAEAFDVTEVLLFRSDLHPDGARYTPLQRVPLSPGGA
jgi:2'-5' RNA ligase